MPYQGGKRAYPVHPPLLCRSETVFPWATAVGFDVDVDEGVDVDVEPGFEPMPGFGADPVPPQPTNVRATKTSKQIFTTNSPACDFEPRRVRSANATQHFVKGAST